MDEKDDWTLFLETGLPQAYTYLKAQERKKSEPEPDSRPDHRSGERRTEI
ncbi:MAG: hypothetical protein ACI3VN_01865 [Candidatus Onthomonas sp.]